MLRLRANGTNGLRATLAAGVKHMLGPFSSRNSHRLSRGDHRHIRAQAGAVRSCSLPTRGWSVWSRVAAVVGLGVVFVAIGFPRAVAFAGTPQRFAHNSAPDFMRGEATSTMVLSTGDVVRGFSVAEIEADAAFLWCAARSKDTAFFGSGTKGQIFAVSTKDLKSPAPKTDASKTNPKVGPKTGPKRSPNKKARLLTALPEPWVTALAVRSDGQLLAATAPGAHVYLIDPGTGRFKRLVDVGESAQVKHVWALVPDGKSGRTFAATGLPGKVVAINRNGDVKPVWDSGDAHVLALEPGPNGPASGLLAGTAENGVLYRVSPSGKATALHDFAAQEVRAVVQSGSDVLIAVNAFKDGSAGDSSNLKGTPLGFGPEPSEGTAQAPRVPRPGAADARGAVYRLSSEGIVELLLPVTDGYVSDLQRSSDGAVYASTSADGKVYRIVDDRTITLAVDLPARQALALVARDDQLFVGTGDNGAVFHVGASAGQGIYLSEVLDAGRVARWGTLRYVGSGALAVETRSGNTAEPGPAWETWRRLEAAGMMASDWSGGGGVTSQVGRYLQYRITLKAAARLRELEIFYLPQNERARVEQLSAARMPPEMAQGSESSGPKGTVQLNWLVVNPDGDPLGFELAYKQEGEPTWRSIGGPEPLRAPTYAWNTTSVPDGRYVIRVQTSDGVSVAQDQALTHAFISAPVLIDNTRPRVEALRARGTVIQGRAIDSESSLTKIEFSVDGGPWSPVSPDDGILDSPKEVFSLRALEVKTGSHVVAVRAVDESGNIGLGRLVIQAAGTAQK